ncbi:MAG: uracil-DNA glycosylase [Candidatus Eisenbacteria sp.]|nr:uracil-DNA glycosylase [Candidatus Eisenbacteria bacterium]
MDREQIRKELALQLEGEIGRGIAFWADEEWNAAARRLLSRQPAPAESAEPRESARVDPKGPPTEAPGAPAPRRTPRRTPRPQFGPPPLATGRDPDWEAQLAALSEEAHQCVKCRLHETRRKVVVSSGSGRVPLVFASEAPGADEDAQGEAFVGRAGQLLTKIIAAIGLDRKDVYICNVLKCRPPGNRNPMADEIESCTPYLQRQLAILKPRLICTLGLFATQVLLESKAPIGKLRGRVFRYQGIPLVPTYHPAALLRNPNLKRNVWEDMLLVRKILDEGLPAPAVPAEEVPARSAKPRIESGNLFGQS